MFIALVREFALAFCLTNFKNAWKTIAYSSVNLCPVFYLKASLWHTEPFRMTLVRS